MNDPLECLTCGNAWTPEEVRALSFFRLLVDCCDEVIIHRCPKCNPKIKRLKTNERNQKEYC